MKTSNRKYSEIAIRNLTIGGRNINAGEIIREVSISVRDAEIMNSTAGQRPDEPGFKYILVEEKSTITEKNEKEYRATLFAKAEELGLTPPKNIKTENLEKQIIEAESK
jgi:hypothetical protein